MGWKEAIAYAKGVAASRGVDVAKRAARSDDGLPLGARIGGLITMQMSPFIRATAAGSLIESPAAAQGLIVAISRVKLNLEGKLYRYYLATGDAVTGDAASAKEAFLQVFVSDTGDVAEIMYCSQLTRLIPETEDDQKAFTGEGGAGLGQLNYSLWREQLAGQGYAESVLAGAFGEAEQIDFQRDAGGADVDFVTPFTGSETRIDDALGEHGLTQELFFMPYVRELPAGGGREYLVITTEIVESRDGDESKRGIHVDFMIGLPLEKERITIQ